MKKTIIGTMLIIAAACLAAGGQTFSKQGERFLVLGFQSRQLNDVQDRLLRETILYRLHTGGRAVVPVMEIEARFQEDAKLRIRSLSRAEVRALCKELNAGWACYGSLAPEDSKKNDDPEIRKGMKYICLLTLYRMSDDNFMEVRLTVTGRESLYGFFTDCGVQVADAIERAVRGG